jgi:hypothetical protein
VDRDEDEWIVVGSRGHVAHAKPRLSERKADKAETDSEAIEVSVKGKAQVGESGKKAALQQERPPQQEQRESSSAGKGTPSKGADNGKADKEAGSDGEDNVDTNPAAVPEEGVDILAEQLM